MYSNVIIQTISLTTRVWELANIQMYQKPHILGSKNITRGVQSKIVSKICEGIYCSSFHVKEFDAGVHKKYFPCITLLNFWPFCTPNH